MPVSSSAVVSTRAMRALSFWHGVTVAALRELPVDLSVRQTAVLLHVYMTPPPHGVKSLAAALAISKPAVCRALDTLEEARLVKRGRDRQDGRGVVIRRTAKGEAYLGQLADIIVAAMKE